MQPMYHPLQDCSLSKAVAEPCGISTTAASAWLNANRPGEKNGPKGTAEYQKAQKLKRALALSNVNQMDVFSRLMMDRIIFLGTQIDDYTASKSTSGSNVPGRTVIGFSPLSIIFALWAGTRPEFSTFLSASRIMIG